MVKAILLFSDGLDSLLAGLMLKKQGIEVIPLKLITPFFGWTYKKHPEKFFEKIKSLGFKEGYLQDITQRFLSVLKKPRYGYGSYANPCIDCKILMLKCAKEFMDKTGADFIATGEVVGQRPMSQNKPALELIEKQAEVSGKVLRPLSAKLLPPTLPEIKGLVNREELLDIKGRKRNLQIELAKNFGIKEIPPVSGGCLLTDPQIGSRVLRVLKENRPLTPVTAEILTLGRHFFEENLWIVLGRHQEENLHLENLASGNYRIFKLNFPSPTAILIQGNPPIDYIKNLLMRYSKKARQALERGEMVECIES